MLRKLSVTHESWPLKKIFTISRGSKTSADIVYVEIEEGDHIGRGEAVPYKRYGESIMSVITQITALKNSIEKGINSEELLTVLKAGAARNAIDCALWDLRAKIDNTPVWKNLNKNVSGKITTAMTLGMESPAIMAAEALEYNKYDVLKLKLGSKDVIESVRAVRNVAPSPKLIIDANEAWTEKQIRAWQEELFALNVSLIEQPLPVGKDACLNSFNHLVPICADESCHTAKDIPRLADRYDYVNLKLDKTGGLTEALRAKEEAKLHDLGLMIGCMVATSLSMAPAILLTENADFIDLDGPFLLDVDRQPSLVVGPNCLLYNSDVWG
jgi:L-alanine-DL-glutamate epimerase-like enolase superfamily enzyme